MLKRMDSMQSGIRASNRSLPVVEPLRRSIGDIFEKASEIASPKARTRSVGGKSPTEPNSPNKSPASMRRGKNKNKGELMKRMNSVGSFFGNGRGEIGAAYPSGASVCGGDVSKVDKRGSGEANDVLHNLRRKTKQNMNTNFKSTRNLYDT
jgi:hypothetical protein